MPCHSVLNFAQIVGFVKVVTLISLNCLMVLSKLLHGFFTIDTWTSLSCYMDLSKLIHGF